MKIVDFDITMITLNATSIGVLALNWFSEHMTGIGGFIVLLSVAALNLSKAYVNIKNTKKKK
jgi:hypothetical protein